MSLYFGLIVLTYLLGILRDRYSVLHGIGTPSKYSDINFAGKRNSLLTLTLHGRGTLLTLTLHGRGTLPTLTLE